LPHDVSYLVYFGMAMLPISAAIGSSILGGILAAQEFESGMILEIRLSPVRCVLILVTRIARLALFGLLGVVFTLLALGWRTGKWPASIWPVFLALLPVAVIYGCIGMIAGLRIQRTIPAFLIGLVVSMVGWLLGSAFGLAAGFSPGYAIISRLTPNTHAVELIFPQFFGAQVGNPLISALTLAGMFILTLGLTFMVYQKRVRKQVS
jgi:ABC-2 type transport system permease protein